MVADPVPEDPELDPDPDPGPSIPLYRPEVLVYSALLTMARSVALTTLGTFHERQGAQALLRGAGGGYFSKKREVFGVARQGDGGSSPPNYPQPGRIGDLVG